jgi:hypothetical protein
MPLSDYEQIQNHLAKYCFRVDRGTADEIAELFWEDAFLDLYGQHQGIAAIHTAYVNWIRDMRDPVEGLRHCIAQPCIAIDGDEATSECYVDADAHTRKKGRLIQLRALYKDRLTKRHGEWRFTDRRIVVFRSPLE